MLQENDMAKMVSKDMGGCKSDIAIIVKKYMVTVIMIFTSWQFPFMIESSIFSSQDDMALSASSHQVCKLTITS